MRFTELFAVVVLTTTAAIFAQTTQPTTQQTITPAARAMLDDLRSNYAQLKSLDVAGTISLNLDAGGQKESDSSEFSAEFQAPAKFRHEMKDDLLLVSNGEKGFVYMPGKNKYRPIDVPAKRTAAADLPMPLGDELFVQNPSLMLALSTDAAAELTSGATSLDRGPDVLIDGISYSALEIQSEAQKMQVLVDPQTHLIKQVSIDLRDHLLAKGVPQVNLAMEKIDYTKSAANVQLAEAGFNWSPPSDASLIKPAQQAGDSDQAYPAMALVGKAAPQFSLKDVNGKEVSLADQKGHVVVLDFWATWCPPCRAELPLLDQLSRDLAAKGVKIFALNIQETGEAVQKFLSEQKLGLPVLLDEKGEVAGKYQVQPIPQTVVVDAKGNISNVFIGFGPSSEANLRAAIDAATK